jgi:hypothetical protein
MNKLTNLVSSIKVKSQTSFDSEESQKIFKSSPQSRLNLIDYFKILELEDKLKNLIDYIMQVKSYQQVVYDDDFPHKISKLNNTLKLERDKITGHLFSMLDYAKVVEHFISLLQMTQDCNRVTIIEYHGRRQDKNLKLHEDHHLIICMRASKVYNNLIKLIVSLSDVSALFRKQFDQKGGTNLIIDYFANASFLSDCHLVTQITNKNSIVNNLIENKLLIIRNLSRTINFEETKKEKCAKLLKSLVENYKLKNEYAMIAYNQLAKLVNDFEINNLPEINLIVEKLMELTKTTVTSLENHEKTLRVEYDFDEWDDKKSEVAKVPKCDFNYNLIDLLMTIYYMNKNDKFRYESFTKYRLSDDLKKIILSGNDVEAEYAILLLLEYSFDDRLGPILALDEILIAVIKKILIYKYPNVKLNKYCESFIWIIDNKYGMLATNSLVPLNIRFKNSFTQPKQIKKIFLNCDIKSRKIAIRIENVLKGSGYKVWYMDEKMQEYSLKKQILALESSDSIIMSNFIYIIFKKYN